MGTYTVELTVHDEQGASDTATLDIEVGNRLPDVDFTWSPGQPWILDTVRFGDATKDLDGHVVARVWDFGDGHTSTATSPRHRFGFCGWYRVTLWAFDEDGGVGSASKVVEVGLLPGGRPIQGVCIDATGDPPDVNAEGPTVVFDDVQPAYVSTPAGSNLDFGGTVHSATEVAFVAVRIEGQSANMLKTTRPDAGGLWEVGFDQFLWPGTYSVTATAFDVNETAGAPARIEITVV